MGEKDLERWRLQETRFEITQPFKVGELHLTRRMYPGDAWQRSGGPGTPEQMLPLGQLTHPWIRGGSRSPPPPIKAPDFGSHPDSPVHPSPGDKVIKKQSLIKTFVEEEMGWHEGGGAGALLPVRLGD